VTGRATVRVVFLGNHTVGVTALQALLSCGAEVSAVVAHPEDEEDGVRYASVYDFARRRNLNTARLAGSDAGLETFIANARPDLIWITDYRYLVGDAVIALAPAGAVNLHPSLLPRYRGRAPINWAIINGETRLGLTAHFVDDGMDSGDIIEQVGFYLERDEDVGVALERLIPLYDRMSRSVFGAFLTGKVVRAPQDHSLATVYPRRTPEDGVIDWAQDAERVRDFVRALARPYPGAFAFLRGERCSIWRATAAYSDAGNAPAAAPGTVISADRDGFRVQAGEGCVDVSEFSPANCRPQPGDRLAMS